MKTRIPLLLAVIGLLLIQTRVSSQVSGSSYNPAGIPVDITRDLNDTFTSLPGINARIRLPKYFEDFSYSNNIGFIHKATSTTIFAKMYPGMTYVAYTRQLTDSVFSAQGATLIEKLDYTLKNGRTAKAYVLRFQTDVGEGIRIMYYTGDYQTMYYLMSSTPEMVSTMVRNVILESFKTLDY